MTPGVWPLLEEERRRKAELCEAIGVDPGRVIDVEWHSGRPKQVRLVILDDPATGGRHAEDHPIPEGWQW